MHCHASLLILFFYWCTTFLLCVCVCVCVRARKIYEMSTVENLDSVHIIKPSLYDISLLPTHIWILKLLILFLRLSFLRMWVLQTLTSFHVFTSFGVCVNERSSMCSNLIPCQAYLYSSAGSTLMLSFYTEI
jgi:hypothetical protein